MLIQPKPITRKYEDIIRNINEGFYQIPKFQRDFVWKKEQVAKLIDSLIKGFPIGSFILWKTKERLRSLKKIGNYFLNDIKEGDFVLYVLDGQQRMTSLYLAINGVQIEKEDYKELYINLDKLETNEEICSIEKGKGNYISFYDLMNASIVDLVNNFNKDLDKIHKIEKIRDWIKSYEFSTIEIDDTSIERITEIFTRINTTGKDLTLFEIMNAKVYDENKKFDLEDSYNNLIRELEISAYETIAENKTIILQLLSLNLIKNSKTSAILSINKNQFIDEWDNTIKALKLAIDKIRDYFKIEVSKLLPYYVLIVPIAYFYRINDFKPPTNTQLKQIERYFFRCAISWRFSSSVESKLNSDIKIIENIKNNINVNFDKELPLQNKQKNYFIELLKEDFSSSNAFDKAVLCILAYNEPKKFSDNSKVRLDNSYLSIASSKNYHHFFPKAYLKRINNTDNANALANITLVDDYLNKRIIRDRNPQEYIKYFEKENSNIDEALKSHFIVHDDFVDYNLFLDKRANALAEEILKRI
ncbi:DUF262 domain-containing protein [Campylobacter lari]|uniref:GmrSD restriction endonuclease domain-containing protein n=1 Tax=Campylobacter sp. IFREMER_LSEM_CL2151 TaxID=2911620 RepID=UPI00185BC495|nr:DUF262 domain-containing protein [Campylobacter sp. IFREMER_LSEM_CL2151]EGK8022651.1 DUF262 domain-containing protein [Campylobacter lari]MCV3374861.1 DUF262 domain-containing protein [Campylobacter sp. IFREMER_LSEM_CL2151]QYH03317.1 DUF262 domain-containing protein [Campylobacter lari]